MTPPQTVVLADRLRVVFPGPVQALEDVSLTVTAGEFVSLVGPSGCGKSTLLNHVAGLASPSSGSLRVWNQEPAAARKKRAGVSFVFQDPTLLPWRNAADNIALPLELEGMPRAERQQRVRESLDLVDLGDFARRYPAELSGGMRMRVSLARALVTRPKLLLLDEPFAALDEITRQTLNEELLRLWLRDRWTGLFVTHNIAEAVFLSTRVLLMSPRPGRIVEEYPVPFPHPRRPELRAEADFAALVGRIAAGLRKGAA